MPIIVTENGVADERDQYRDWWLTETVMAMRRAMSEGVEVHGYMHWSLLDNFEWKYGWWPKFGLVAVDREHGMRRTVRPSARRFAQQLRELRGLGDGDQSVGMTSRRPQSRPQPAKPQPTVSAASKPASHGRLRPLIQPASAQARQGMVVTKPVAKTVLPKTSPVAAKPRIATPKPAQASVHSQAVRPAVAKPVTTSATQARPAAPANRSAQPALSTEAHVPAARRIRPRKNGASGRGQHYSL